MTDSDNASDVDLRLKIECLQAELDQAQRMAIVGELASTTTHEFNNLLTTIINYAKLGLRHKDENSRDKALQKIHDAAQRAAKITSTVLSMSRNRAGQLEPMDLRALINDTMLLMEREFRKYRINVETDLQAVPNVNASPTHIQRVLLNLLVNARQATHEGGTVSVRLQNDSLGNEAVLMVRDNGKGISKELLPKIFDPFFTTKAGPDATGKGGSGLGLATCKQTIDSHGGRIRVDSSPGKGTCITIRLPLLAA